MNNNTDKISAEISDLYSNINFNIMKIAYNEESKISYKTDLSGESFISLNNNQSLIGVRKTKDEYQMQIGYADVEFYDARGIYDTLLSAYKKRYPKEYAEIKDIARKELVEKRLKETKKIEDFIKNMHSDKIK